MIDTNNIHNHRSLCLCVTKTNHALKLYEKNGFLKYEDLGDSYIMLIPLD